MTTPTKKTTARPPRKTEVPLTFAAMRSRIQRPRRYVDLVMDAEAAAEVLALEDLLEQAQRHDEVTGAETARDVARILQDAEGRAEASRVRFTLEAISHRAYQALRKEHPPTKEQIEAAVRAGGEGEPHYDPDTFAPALVMAQLTDPTPADADEFAAFWDDLSDGQANQLWMPAVAVQLQIPELGPRSQAAAELLRSFGLPTA
jgi:hypothetical protein